MSGAVNWRGGVQDPLTCVVSRRSWMYGVASDPVKVAQMRSMMRNFVQCATAGACNATSEPGVFDFTRGLLKLPEHTWGGCASTHMNVE